MGSQIDTLEKRVHEYYTDIERYDWITDTKYPEKLFHIARSKAIINLVNKNIKHTEVLDVGCGTGLITRGIEADSITAIDINEWALEKAKRHINFEDGNHRVKFAVGNAENIPYVSNRFDVVVCTECLEHLVNMQKALKEIYRVLKGDGIFIGSVPSKSIVWKWRKQITRTSPAKEPFHNNFGIKEVRPLLWKSGFYEADAKYIAFGLSIMFIAKK